MFTALANQGNIANRAQQICQQLRDNLNAASAFYDWLVLQQDAELIQQNFTQGDINLLRAAFNDLHALGLFCYGQPIPPSLTQGAVTSTYNITGTYNFALSVTEITGAT